MSNARQRSHDPIMQPPGAKVEARDGPPSGQVRVTVWSPFEQLTSELQRLIDNSGEAISVHLCRGCTLMQAIRDSSADLAVLDVDASPIGACNLVADIHRSNPDLSILALSARCDCRLAVSALNAGARGYVFKDRAFEELLDAIRALKRGARYVSPAIDRSAAGS